MTPVVAQVRRGREIESRHRGDVAVVAEDERLLARVGDPSLRIFLRSAANPFQILPFLEAGGDQEFGLGPGDIALICASHGGEPRHVRGAERLLRLAGYRASDLV